MKQNNSMEQLLALALQDAVERTQPALQNETEWAAAGMESHTFATAFEKRMKHLCAQEKRRVWFERHQKGLRNAVAGMAVLLCVGGVTIASVDAIRTPLLQYFLKIGDVSSQYIPSSVIHLPVSDQMAVYYPTYIPEGCVVVDVIEYDTRYSVTYQKENSGSFVLNFDLKNIAQSFDTENSVVEEIEIQGIPAVVSTRDDQTIVIWQGDGFSYSIAGNLEKEECIRILESTRVGD